METAGRRRFERKARNVQFQREYCCRLLEGWIARPHRVRASDLFVESLLHCLIQKMIDSNVVDPYAQGRSQRLPQRVEMCQQLVDIIVHKISLNTPRCQSHFVRTYAVRTLFTRCIKAKFRFAFHKAVFTSMWGRGHPVNHRGEATNLYPPGMHLPQRAVPQPKPTNQSK